jgi:membrane protease YdiL (CAAX protease family)
MITVGTILTIVLIVIVLVILFKLLNLISSALNIPAPWAQIIYWILVLIVVIWAFGFFGITQPIVK